MTEEFEFRREAEAADHDFIETQFRDVGGQHSGLAPGRRDVGQNADAAQFMRANVAALNQESGASASGDAGHKSRGTRTTCAGISNFGGDPDRRGHVRREAQSPSAAPDRSPQGAAETNDLEKPTGLTSRPKSAAKAARGAGHAARPRCGTPPATKPASAGPAASRHSEPAHPAQTAPHPSRDGRPDHYLSETQRENVGAETSGESRAGDHQGVETQACRVSGTASACGRADEAIVQPEPARAPPRQHPPGRKAGNDPGHTSADAQSTDAGVALPSADALTIAMIREQWRRRQQWHRAEKRLTLQCSAICRGASDGNKVEAARQLKRIEEERTAPGDARAELSCMPLLAARNMIRQHREAVEKTLEKLARKLPIAAWTKTVYGCGDLSLAAVIGEAGDLSEWRTVSGLWKHMGLAVIGGERQRKKSGDAAFEQGYAPARRSAMWNIGGGLIGGLGRGPRPGVGEDVSQRDDLSPYQKLFVKELRKWADRDPEAHRREPTVNEKTGELRESFSAHAVAHAKRVVTKKFLRDLYGEWRRQANLGAELHHDRA